MKRSLLFLLLLVAFYSCRKTTNTNPETLPDAYSNQALGKSANDVLSAAKYTSINIQVQYMGSFQLDTATITNVTNYLNAICNKPDGVTMTQSSISATGDTLNLTQIAIMERQNRTAYTSGNSLALYVMVTDGFDTAASVLGFAYRNTSICLFGKDIFSNSGAAGQVSRVNLESSVLEHELGHIMGLVNLGTPMVNFHQDTAHGNHCNNPKCLMYWETETHTGFPLPINTKINTLDSNCLLDLAANGGK